MLKQWWSLAAVRLGATRSAPAAAAPPAALDLGDDELESVVGGLSRALYPVVPERAPGSE